MRRTPKNILFHELIGLRVKVIQYTDPTVVGVEGIIVDETQKTFIIEKSDGKRIRVFKENGVFELKIPGASPVVVRGEKLFGRPWDRLKKVLTARGWSA
jgi:ribonuclease P protein subunit POP4